MEYLQWPPNLSVGDATLDSHHMKLIARINMTFDTMNGPDPQVPTAILTELLAGILDHFAEEEKLMEETGFPDLEEHRQIHAALAQQLVNYQKEANAVSQAVPAKEIFQFLSHWLIDHIVGQDLKYAPYLEGRGKALPVAEQ